MMKLDELQQQMQEINERRYSKADYNNFAQENTNKWSERVKGWLLDGCSVAAVFVGGKLSTVHQHDFEGKNAAKTLLGHGYARESIKVKRIVI